jgi:hypothetical protein
MYSFLSAAESFHASVKRIVFVDVSRLAMVESREGCVCGVFGTKAIGMGGGCDGQETVA